MLGADEALNEIRAAVQRQSRVERVMGRVRDLVQSLSAEPGLEFHFHSSQGDPDDPDQLDAFFVELTVAVRPVRQIAAPPPDQGGAESGGAGIPEGDAAPEPHVPREAKGGSRTGGAAAGEARSAAQRRSADGREKAPAEPQNSLAERFANQWSQDEDRKLCELRATGRTYLEISRELDRSKRACELRYNKIRRQEHSSVPPIEQAAPEEAPNRGAVIAATAAPAPEAATPSPRGASPAFGASLDRLAAVEKHLDRCADDGWTDADDLHLVRALARGDKASHIATDLAIEPEAIIQRFRRLCPDPTPERQADLIRALSRRAEREAV